MDPANNPSTNNNPASGAAPSTPPAVNPLQPTPAASAPPAAGTPASVPPVSAATPGAPQMPSMTEALNMVAADSAAQAPAVPPVPNVAPQGTATAMGGVVASAPASPVVPPAAVPVEPPVDAVQDEVVETLSVASEKVKPMPAAPIARPTNIDGINSARMPKMPAAAAPGRSAAPNPFIDTTSKQTPSVSFTDPMTEPEKDTTEPMTTPIAASKKKKSSKTVLIVLSVIAFLAAVALAGVLVMELMGVGPFAKNDNSGQTSSQLQSSDSTNGNSSNSGSNNGGSSSNSGSNSTSGGGTGASANATPGSIVCNTTKVENGITMDSEFIFNITNNKIVSVTMNAVATDANGNQEKASETRTFQEMVDGGEMVGENMYIESDGTLKTTAEEFAGYIEENLDLGSESLVCEVK